MTNNGTMTMDAGSRSTATTANTVFNNAGTLVASPGSTATATLSGGNLTVNNTGSIQLASGPFDVQNATLNLNAGSVSGTGTLEVQGTLGVNTAQSLASPLVVSGTVNGSGALSVTGTLTTTGGSFGGPGTVTVASGATWDVTARRTTSVERRHAGQRRHGHHRMPDADLDIYSGVTVTNNGTMTMDAGREIYGYTTPTRCSTTPGPSWPPWLDGNAPPSIGGDLTANNTGSIELSSGTLDVYSATLNLNAGSVSGTARSRSKAPSGSIPPRASPAPSSISGTVKGSGALSVTGTLTTPGGTFDGPGTVTVATGATWNVSRVVHHVGRRRHVGQRRHGARSTPSAL